MAGGFKKGLSQMGVVVSAVGKRGGVARICELCERNGCPFCFELVAAKNACCAEQSHACFTAWVPSSTFELSAACFAVSWALNASFDWPGLLPILHLMPPRFLAFSEEGLLAAQALVLLRHPIAFVLTFYGDSPLRLHASA